MFFAPQDFPLIFTSTAFQAHMDQGFLTSLRHLWETQEITNLSDLSHLEDQFAPAVKAHAKAFFDLPSNRHLAALGYDAEESGTTWLQCALDDIQLSHISNSDDFFCVSDFFDDSLNYTETETESL